LICDLTEAGAEVGGTAPARAEPEAVVLAGCPRPSLRSPPPARLPASSTRHQGCAGAWALRGQVARCRGGRFRPATREERRWL